MSDSDFDTREFRKSLGQFATGVTIITTNNKNGDPVGVTASSFNTVSMNPPLILWSLAKNAYSLDAFQDASHLNVHVLGIEQESLSNLFASRGADKFDGVTYHEGDYGVPLLDNCAARFQCRTVHRYDGGDHIIIVAEVLAYDRKEVKPLLFHGGNYAASLPKSAPEQDTDLAELNDGRFSSDFLIYLLSRAYFQSSHAIRSNEEDHGLPRAAHYIVSVLCQQSALSRDSICERLAVTGEIPGDDLFDKMVQLQLLAASGTNGDATYSVTESGRALQVSTLVKALEIEEEILADFGRDELALFKHMLRRLIAKTDTGLPNAWT